MNLGAARRRWIALLAFGLSLLPAATLGVIGRDAPAQPGEPCPAASPGAVLWSAPGSWAFNDTVMLAVGDDGTAYGALKSSSIGWLFAYDCHGRQRWAFGPNQAELGFRELWSVIALPVIDDDGRLNVALIQLNSGLASRIVSLVDHGSYVEARWGHSSSVEPALFLFNQALDRAGNLIAPAVIVSPDREAVTILDAVDRFGGAVGGFPVPLPAAAFTGLGAPVVLPDQRVALVSAEHTVADTVTAVPPPTPSPSVTPDRTGYRHVALLPLARTDRVWWATPGRPTHIPHLPSSTPLPTETSPAPAQPPVPTPTHRRPAPETPGLLPTEAPVVVREVPAQLHVIRPDRPALASFPVEPATIFELVAAGGVVIGASVAPEHEIVAFAVDGPTPRKLWSHRTGAEVVESPILGREDPDTGRIELLYLRADGVLVSLDVPGGADDVAPTFNWAIELDGVPTRSITFRAPILGDSGHAYVAHGAFVSAVDRRDGTIAWSTALPGGNGLSGGFAMAPGGVLYVTTASHIVAIATESRGLDPNALWPAFRHDSRRTGRAHR